VAGPPEVKIFRFGTMCERSLTSRMFFSSMAWSVTTPTDEGTSCAFSSRFCAVTVIVGRVCGAAGSSAARLRPPKAGTSSAAHIPASGMQRLNGITFLLRLKL
jgi:hypothetical protein